MNKNVKEFLITLLILTTCLFSFYGVSYLINTNSNNEEDENKKIIDILKKDKEKEKEKTKEKEKEEEKPYVEPYVNTIPTFRNNYGNPNIMGIIQVPGIINEALVARAGDNEFYLDRNLWNVYDGIGAPFFDYRNTDLDNAKQINIYGHNSQNANILDRLPLAKMINYLDLNIFNTYKDLYLYTDTQKVHYEIIGVKIIQKSNNYHMTIRFFDDKDFIDHTNSLLNGSVNRRDVTITKNDRILVLQTCNYNPPDTLVLIICKTV